MRRYAVTEIFYTLQGEGFYAGAPAVFVRLAACNMWSGRDEDRERDAVANRAECPRWCDTDFGVRQRLTAQEVAACVDTLSMESMVVITGGEPLLQLDVDLVDALRSRIERVVAVETNGTVLPRAGVRERCWITMSPKTAPAEIQLEAPNELKVVFPAYDPNAYLGVAGDRALLYVQPLADTFSVGKSLVNADNTRRAAAFVQANPRWRLSLQTHKILGLP